MYMFIALLYLKISKKNEGPRAKRPFVCDVSDSSYKELKGKEFVSFGLPVNGGPNPDIFPRGIIPQNFIL